MSTHTVPLKGSPEFKERERAYSRAAYLRNRDKKLAAAKAYRKNKPEVGRASALKWIKNNPTKRKQHVSKRRAALFGRIHPGFDKKLEIALFVQAAMLGESTGVKHHVDHIIPLLHGGWHHHLNMQVLPALVNQKKWADPFWQVEGYKSWRDVPSYLWPEALAPQYNKLLNA